MHVASNLLFQRIILSVWSSQRSLKQEISTRYWLRQQVDISYSTELGRRFV